MSLTSNISAKTWSNCTCRGCFEKSGPADFKSVPGFENQPRFVGVIEQNKIQQTFFHYCISNTLFLLFSGGFDADTKFFSSDKILLWDEKTTTFKEIGKLEQRRRDHSVSLVDINDFTCS